MLHTSHVQIQGAPKINQKVETLVCALIGLLQQQTDKAINSIQPMLGQKAQLLRTSA